MMQDGQRGSVVTLLCDSGTRYLDTYYNPDWVRQNIGDIAAPLRKLETWG
jgi:cysteine synthase A